METKKLKKILAIIFCICLAIYFAYAVILLIIHPTEIYVITKGEIKEEEETVGYIIRNETVIKAFAQKGASLLGESFIIEIIEQVVDLRILFYCLYILPFQALLRLAFLHIL